MRSKSFKLAGYDGQNWTLKSSLFNKQIRLGQTYLKVTQYGPAHLISLTKIEDEALDF